MRKKQKGDAIAEEYRSHGIEYRYNPLNKGVYLSIMNAPLVISTEPLELTGYLIADSIENSSDVLYWVNKLKETYSERWQDDDKMMSYLGDVN